MIKNLIKQLLLVFLWSSLVAIHSASAENGDKNPITESTIQAFCSEKPIWLAFDISNSDCTRAASYCANKAEFAQLEPDVLSEEYYACVFDSLGIEID